MKILIAYYSRTANTEKLAQAIKKEFESHHHDVDIEKVEPRKEHSFWSWFFIRLFKGESEIQKPKIRDVSKYDSICIGSPNWTRVSLPIARYLREIKGLKYKSVGTFSTTALPPHLEWYIFSAYLFDYTLAKIIEEKGGRVIDSIMFSSLFSKWNPTSQYGKRLIKNFCKRIETPIYSLKNYLLAQKETEGTRVIMVTFLTSLFLFLVFQIASSAINTQFFTWDQFILLFLIGLITCFSLLTITATRTGVFLGKYLLGISSVILWTLAVLILEPAMGRPILLGYILLFIIISFFRDFRALIFTGAISLLCYGFLFFNYPLKEIFCPGVDLIFLLLAIGIVGFITRNLQKHCIGLIEAQEEIETAKEVLEVKVRARTKELRELAESLEEQVKERTKRIQARVTELERFHRLTVGRELKMIELKKEAKELKEKIKECKKAEQKSKN